MSVNDSADRPHVDPQLGEPAWWLLDELRDRLDAPDLQFSAPPRRLGGGFWAEMYELHLADPPAGLPGEVVARIAPDAEMSVWETAVQAGVAAQGFPTPAILLSGGPEGPVGRAWSLMEVAHGQPLLAGLSGPAALIRLPQLARRLPDQLASITAQLHRLDPDPIRADLEQLTTRKVGMDELLDHLGVRAVDATDPRLLGSVEHLRATRLDPTRLVLCHGDLHPFNVLADGDRLTLLDWTASQVADPTYDLAVTALLVGHPPLSAPPVLRPVIAAAARRLASRFLSRYEVHSGTEIDRERLAWHTTLQATRILIEADAWQSEGAADRHDGHPWHALVPEMRRIVDSSIGG